VIAAEVVEERIRAAAAARDSTIYFSLREQMRANPKSSPRAFRRAERYVKGGANGIYVEAPKELEAIGKSLTTRRSSYRKSSINGALDDSVSNDAANSGCPLSGGSDEESAGRQRGFGKGARRHEAVRRDRRPAVLGRD
jgi:hypothetical protein